jgi:hypothetical protein
VNFSGGRTHGGFLPKQGKIERRGGPARAHAQGGGGGGAWTACDMVGRQWGSSAGRTHAQQAVGGATAKLETGEGNR